MTGIQWVYVYCFSTTVSTLPLVTTGPVELKYMQG